MHREIEIENDNGNGNGNGSRIRGGLFSIPSLVSLGASLIATAFAFGIVAQKVDQNSDSIVALQNRSGAMTPQAAQEIAALKAVSVAQQQQLLDLRSEMRDDRREFTAAIQDLSSQLRAHMERGSGRQ